MRAWKWPNLLRLSFVLVAVSFLTISCTGGGDEPAPDTAPDPSAAIEGFDPTTDARAAVGAINAAAADDREALLAVALEHLDATDPDERWAAVYALTVSATPDDEAALAALREILGSDDVDERLNAAGSVAAMGQSEALPVLIDLLDSDAQLRYLVLPAWRVAADMLLAYTEEDFGILDALEPKSRAKAKAAWEAWWAERGSDLVWRPDDTTFV
jgi:HEAT repeat protein